MALTLAEQRELPGSDELEIVLVSDPTLYSLRRYANKTDISWEAEAWLAEATEHMIHY